MITAIDISKFNDYKSIPSTTSLNNLTRINLFVGPNNSGKSRFLRRLLLTKLSVRLTEIETAFVVELIKNLKNQVESICGPYSPANTEIHNARERFKRIEAPEFSDAIENFQILQNELINLSQLQSNSISDGSGGNPQNVFREIRNVIQPYIQQVVEFVRGIANVKMPNRKIYLPILRGLRPVQSTGHPPAGFDHQVDNYRLRIERDYQISEKQEVDIHTGLDMFKKVTELMLGDDDDRLKIQKFENYLSQTFFYGKEVHIVPRIGKDVIYVKIGNDKQYPIYELGEGIQSIILLTYPLFFNEGEQILFFIEEPELHLHPGLERIFIETLCSPRFHSFQFFITTHSNHILDLTLDHDKIAIFSFEKSQESYQPNFSITNVNSDHKRLLELLGVRNSSVFLSNCTIWIEGITDRLYLRKFFEIMQPGMQLNFKEDYHYSFVEYAGNNITHWSFLADEDSGSANINVESICSKIFLIADSDGVDLPSKKRNKEKKKKRQQQLKEKLGDNFYLTKGVEVENMLSKEIIKKVIIEMEGGAHELDFKAFDKADHTNHYLGDFIEKNVKGIRRKYNTDYGTIYDKLGFCKRAIAHISDRQDLSDEASELTEMLLNFIYKANSQ